jgi:hypothetical protein
MKRAVKESDRAPSLVRGDLIQNVAIVAIYHENQRFSWIKNYVEDWRKRGMRSVDFFLYFPQKKQWETFAGRTMDVPFTSRHFNWIGKAVQPELVAALKKEYDVMIDLTRGESFACDVVLSKANAKWKTGEPSDERSFLLDFMIDVKDDPDIRNLMHHIDHYLTQLNKPNAA